jgi:hypothetical protein
MGYSCAQGKASHHLYQGLEQGFEQVFERQAQNSETRPNHNDTLFFICSILPPGVKLCAASYSSYSTRCFDPHLAGLTNACASAVTPLLPARTWLLTVDETAD